jgi:hypothetical protein
MPGISAASPATLTVLVAACDQLLADDGWFADRPDEWRDEIEDLRDRLAAQLEEHVV